MWKLLALVIILAGAFAAEDPVPQPIPKPAPQPPPQLPSQTPTAQKPVAQVAPTSEVQKPAPGVKKEAAAGRYDGGRDYDRDGGYDQDYGHSHSYGHKILRGYNVPLVDDYVCDLDATILVVTNADDGQDHSYSAPAQDSTYAPTANNNYNRIKKDAYGSGYDHVHSKGRDYDHHHRYGSKHDYGYDKGHDYEHGHHYGYSGIAANADRLRCSIIASNDEDSCTACCQLSARRDRSISRNKIIGFLVDNNQLNLEAPEAGHGGHSYDDYNAARKKRSTTYQVPQPATYAAAPLPYAPEPEPDFRCVCCAPKRYRPFAFDRYFSRHGHGRRHHGYGRYDGPY